MRKEPDAASKCDNNSSTQLEKKQDKKCPEKESSSTEQKKNEGNCNTSYTKFKESVKDKRCDSTTQEAEKQCHSSQEEFFKSRQDKSELGGGDKDGNQCRDSYHIYLQEKRGQCKSPLVSNAHERISENKHDRCPTTGDDGPHQKGPCESAYAKMKKSEQHNVCETAKEKKKCDQILAKVSPEPDTIGKCQRENCESAYGKLKNADPYESIRKREPGPCESAFDKIKTTTCSKVSDYCKNFAKQYVKLRADPKSAGDATAKTPDIPFSNPPSDPIAEKGSVVSPGCSKDTRSDPVRPSWADFFPIDARNKKLNECIEKYTRIDPSQVISKCSQLASRTSALSSQCVESARRSQEKWSTSETARRLWPGTLRPRSLGRWGPSAAAYLAAAALATVYVTEWKAVLKHVPGYSHLAEQQEENPPS